MNGSELAAVPQVRAGRLIAVGWFGILVPARTPPSVIAKLSAEVFKAAGARPD